MKIDKMSHESGTNNKYYLVHVTKAIVCLSHDNPLALGIDIMHMNMSEKNFSEKTVYGISIFIQIGDWRIK